MENNIFNNKVGLYISNNTCLASDNLIYHNNFKNVWQEGPFKDTWKQAFVDVYHNDLFDKGYPEGGNYWSDYTGEDANKDGIGDTSYTFSNSSEDRYPFMRENGWKKEKIPQWRKNILSGDILYDPFASGVGHVGLYIGDDRVIEAMGSLVPGEYPGKVKNDPITLWDYPQKNTVYLLRVKKPADLSNAKWEEKINKAIDFAKKQQSPVAKPYDWHWNKKQYKIDSPSWYCSELVWVAYFNQGVDLEFNSLNVPIIIPTPTAVPIIVDFSPVSPAEIFDDDDTKVVSSHLEGIDKIPWYKKFAPLFIFSPVNVTITDKDSHILNQAKGTNNIPGATFIEDQTNASGHKYSVIYLPVEYGPYKIQVVRKPIIPQDENTYSLKTKTEKGDIWLAENHPLPAENKEDDYKLNPVEMSNYNHNYNFSDNNIEWGFNDTEKSSGNNFRASTLDFSTSAKGNFSPKVSPTKETTRSILISKENGSEDFKYRVSAKNFTGDDDLCNNLEIKEKDESDDKYQDLKTYVSSDTDISTKTKWDFIVRLKDESSELAEKICKFDLVFNGWQENMNYGAGGFTDTETVTDTIESDKWVNPGDVVINEVMWMGSTSSAEDEWIELRNMTNHNIDLKNWEIENAESSHGTYTIPNNNSISANGYFLIARKDSANTALNVTPNITGAKLSLANSGNGSLILKTNSNKVIDSTPTSWLAGINETNGGLHESMERDDIPSKGWHTCTSGEANGGTYWKTAENTTEGNNFGTPGSANLSPIVMNEILAHPSEGENQRVELYNLSDKDYDIAGWYFKNSKGDKIIISKNNTDNRETIISGKELLVVNLGKNFLDKSNDTLAFYNNKGTPDDDNDDVEEDIYQYKNSTKEAGDSFARIPNGTGIWVDPKATLGKKNKLGEKELASFQKLTLNQCFNKKGELINNNKKNICESIFLQYLGMLKEVDSQKADTKLVKGIKEKETQEQKEKESPEKMNNSLKIFTKKVSSLSQSKNVLRDSLSDDENSQDETAGKAVIEIKKTGDSLKVAKKDIEEKTKKLSNENTEKSETKTEIKTNQEKLTKKGVKSVEKTKKNEGKPADENVKPKEVEKKDEEAEKTKDKSETENNTKKTETIKDKAGTEEKIKEMKTEKEVTRIEESPKEKIQLKIFK